MWVIQCFSIGKHIDYVYNWQIVTMLIYFCIYMPRITVTMTKCFRQICGGNHNHGKLVGLNKDSQKIKLLS